MSLIVGQVGNPRLSPKPILSTLDLWDWSHRFWEKGCECFIFTVICEDPSSPFNLLRLQSFGWLVRLVAMTFLRPSSYWYSSIDFSSHIHHNCFKVPTNWPKLPARQFSLPIIHFSPCQCLEAAREGLSLYLSTFVCAHIHTQYLPPWNTKPSGNNAQLILLAALQKSTKGIFPLFYGWKTEACSLTE